MGILDGVMKGVGEGLSEFGSLYMREGFAEDAEARRLESQKVLQKQQSDLMLEREKSLANFKVEMADTLRGKMAARVEAGIAGTVNPQFDAARDAYAKSDLSEEDKALAYSAIEGNRKESIINGTRDPKQIQAALLQSGDYDAAKAIEGVGKKSLHNANITQNVFDESGKMIYDGTSATEKLLAEGKRVAGMSGGGTGSKTSGKLVDPDERLKKTNEAEEKTAKTVAEVFSDHSHPYADPNADKDQKKDVPLLSIAQQAAQEVVDATRMTDRKALQMVKPVLEAYDKKVRELVDARAEAVFEGGGKPGEDVVKELKRQGLDVSDPAAFKRALRDSYMDPKQFKKYAVKPEAGDAYFDDLIKKYRVEKKQNAGGGFKLNNFIGGKTNADETNYDPMGNAIN